MDITTRYLDLPYRQSMRLPYKAGKKPEYIWDSKPSTYRRSWKDAENLAKRSIGKNYKNVRNIYAKKWPDKIWKLDNVCKNFYELHPYRNSEDSIHYKDGIIYAPVNKPKQKRNYKMLYNYQTMQTDKFIPGKDWGDIKLKYKRNKRKFKYPYKNNPDNSIYLKMHNKKTNKISRDRRELRTRFNCSLLYSMDLLKTLSDWEKLELIYLLNFKDE